MRMTLRVWITTCGTALLAALPLSTATAGPADSYLLSARKLENSKDFKAAELELRNTAQAEPGNSAIHLELAQVYLKLGDPNSAQAQLFAAHWRGAKDDAAAPLMAQAMLQMGQFGDLLKNIPPSHRPPKVESLVRSYRGMAALALSDFKTAKDMFSDAERLDPKSAIPIIGTARLLLQQRQYLAAQQKAEQALRADPRDDDAVEIEALSLAGLGKGDAALQLLGRAIAANPHNFRALIDRANLQLQQGKVELAQADVARVRKLAPGNAVALVLQAFIDAQKGRYKAADEIFGKLRGVMTSFPAAYLVAAQVKLKLNQMDQAEEFTKKFLAQAGDEYKAYQLLGVISMKRGKLESALASLERANQLAPKNAEVLALLGQAYVAHGDLDKAKEVFNQAALLAPGDASLATRQALIDFASGDQEAGLAELRSVFKNGKGTLLAGPPLVLESLQYGRIDEAGTAAMALVRRDPANANYQELLAAVKTAQRDFPGAEAVLRKLLQKDSSLVSARRDLAQIYMQTHRGELAKKLYQDRLSSKPDDVESMLQLANIAFSEKDDRGAAQWLAQAQSHVGSDPGPTLRLIAFLEARKKWAEAIARVGALQRKFPKDASVRDAAAYAYFVSGNGAAALAEYKKAAAAFPNSAPIWAHYAGALAAGKDFIGAAAATLRAAHLDPRSLDLKRAYVTLSYQAHGVGGAVTASQKVFADRMTAMLVATDILEANNNRAAAVALLEKFLNEKPTGVAIARLAVLYQRNNQMDKAITLSEEWSKAHATEFSPRLILAQLYSSVGRLAEARSQYEWLASKQPDNPVILNNLAWLYSHDHDARARQTAEKALRFAPNSGAVADTLGWILVNEGQPSDAIKYLQQASARMPTDTTIQYHYAVALSKTGKADQARAVLEKALTSKTGAGSVSEARALLASLKAPH